MNLEKNLRILVIDDNPSIHEDFGKILCGASSSEELDDLEADLFGSETQSMRDEYQLDSAYQGEEGLAKVQAARALGQPYALIFVDMRMPPGWDGVQTIDHIAAEDPDVQLVICTAFSDYSWEEMRRHFGKMDRLLILKKPFDVVEVSQLACALTEKWRLAKLAQIKQSQLEAMVEARTLELQTENAVRRATEEKLRYDALHDSLTGLANRTLLLDRIAYCRRRAQRYPDYHFALVFMDLDRFKVINDSLGHPIGDQLLVSLAHRLQGLGRATDMVARIEGDHLARIGGDEFVLLLDGVANLDAVVQVVECILRALEAPYLLEGHEVFCSGSIGVVMGRPDCERPEDLLRDADTALYKAKALGTGRYVIFDSDMHQSALVRWRTENDLRRGIERGELRLHYQPIISLKTGKVIELEALVRWQHPLLGWVMPADFIPIAEETGLIIPLGDWAMLEACRQLRTWQLAHPELRNFSVAVNVAGRQFAQPGLVASILKVLDQTGVSPHDLRLEITESQIMERAASTLSTLHRLRELNLKFHLDDFGTGYSSLSYLNSMPIDALKIDRSFVSTLGEDPMSQSIIQAIITLAHVLKMHVIAEGVETEEQLEQLRQLHCDAAQGYLISRPMEADQALQWLLVHGLP